MSEETVEGLKRYIGAKFIQAEPGVAPQPMGEYPAGAEGYRVVYEDGYESWSPKEVFEAAYMPTDALSLGLAVEAMVKGVEVTRAAYSQKTRIKFDGGFFQISEGDGPFRPWMPDRSELVVCDWMVVEPVDDSD